MSSSIDSLSGLANIAAEVDMFSTGMCAISRIQFEQLKHSINALQVCCPNHRGVLKARIKWYGFALDNFENLIVIPLENDVEFNFIWSSWWTEARELFADPPTLDFFMKRSYLKDAFPESYKRLIRLLNRTAEALPLRYPGANMGQTRGYFTRMADELQKRLLEGKI